MVVENLLEESSRGRAGIYRDLCSITAGPALRFHNQLPLFSCWLGSSPLPSTFLMPCLPSNNYTTGSSTTSWQLPKLTNNTWHFQTLPTYHFSNLQGDLTRGLKNLFHLAPTWLQV